MADPHVLIWNDILTNILADESSYIIPDIDIEQAALPRERLEDLAAKPKVKVLIPSPGETERLIRNKSSQTDYPIQIAIQQKISPDDVATFKTLMELKGQIQNSCENDFVTSGFSFSWLRTEPLRDKNGLAYSYEDLYNKGVFSSIFTLFFRSIKTK